MNGYLTLIAALPADAQKTEALTETSGRRHMERRKFISGISVVLGAGYLSEMTVAQGKGDSPASGQPPGPKMKATQPTKTFGSFALLPARTIRPEGWLRRYAQINADSWLLMYARSRDPELYDEYRDKRTVKEQGSFTDYMGDFGEDLVHYASDAAGSAGSRRGCPWIKSLLECQEADGYLGGFAAEARWRNWLETYSLAHVLNALLMHYEVTGDKSLLAACERAASVVMQVVSRSSNKAPAGWGCERPVAARRGGVWLRVDPRRRSLFFSQLRQFGRFARATLGQTLHADRQRIVPELCAESTFIDSGKSRRI